MHIRNQLIKPNLRGKGVISLYHMNSYLFKQQYAKSHVKILILEVDFDQYFLSEIFFIEKLVTSREWWTVDEDL